MAVRTIGTGGDFSTPRAWEAALPATLTEPETAQILIQDFSSLSDVNATFDINVLTSAENFITIEPVSGDQDFAADSTTVPFFSYGRGGTFGIITLRNNCNHLSVSGFTVNITAAQTNIVLDSRTAIPADSFIRLENLYSYATGLGSGCTRFRAGTLGYMRNSICVTNGFRALDSATNFEYRNCTVVANFDGEDNDSSGIRRNTAGITEDCVALNFGPTIGNRDYLQNASTFNNNASSDATGSSTALRNLVLANLYTDGANHDWSLVAGNPLIGAATDGGDIGARLPSGGGDERTGVFIDTITLESIFAAAKEAMGVFVVDVDFGSTFIGAKEASGAFSDSAEFASALPGAKEAVGAFNDSVDFASALTAQKEGVGAFDDSFDASSVFVGVAETPSDDREGAFSDAVSFGSVFVGVKESSGVFEDNLALDSELVGAKESVGVFEDVFLTDSRFIGVSSERPIFISEFTIRGTISEVEIQGSITEKTINGVL